MTDSDNCIQLKGEKDWTDNKYYVIQFTTLPYANIDKYIIIPNCWIRLRVSKDTVLVSYPVEDPINTRKRAEIYEKHESAWLIYKAFIKYESSNFNDADVWAASKNHEDINNKVILETENQLKSSSHKPLDSSSDNMRNTTKNSNLSSENNNLSSVIKGNSKTISVETNVSSTVQTTPPVFNLNRIEIKSVKPLRDLPYKHISVVSPDFLFKDSRQETFLNFNEAHNTNGLTWQPEKPQPELKCVQNFVNQYGCQSASIHGDHMMPPRQKTPNKWSSDVNSTIWSQHLPNNCNQSANVGFNKIKYINAKAPPPSTTQSVRQKLYNVTNHQDHVYKLSNPHSTVFNIQGRQMSGDNNILKTNYMELQHINQISSQSCSGTSHFGQNFANGPYIIPNHLYNQSLQSQTTVSNAERNPKILGQKNILSEGQYFPSNDINLQKQLLNVNNIPSVSSKYYHPISRTQTLFNETSSHIAHLQNIANSGSSTLVQSFPNQSNHRTNDRDFQLQNEQIGHFIPEPNKLPAQNQVTSFGGILTSHAAQKLFSSVHQSNNFYERHNIQTFPSNSISHRKPDFQVSKVPISKNSSEWDINSHLNITSSISHSSKSIGHFPTLAQDCSEIYPSTQNTNIGNCTENMHTRLSQNIKTNKNTTMRLLNTTISQRMKSKKPKSVANKQIFPICDRVLDTNISKNTKFHETHIENLPKIDAISQTEALLNPTLPKTEQSNVQSKTNQPTLCSNPKPVLKGFLLQDPCTGDIFIRKSSMLKTSPTLNNLDGNYLTKVHVTDAYTDYWINDINRNEKTSKNDAFIINADQKPIAENSSEPVNHFSNKCIHENSLLLQDISDQFPCNEESTVQKCNEIKYIKPSISREKNAETGSIDQSHSLEKDRVIPIYKNITSQEISTQDFLEILNDPNESNNTPFLGKNIDCTTTENKSVVPDIPESVTRVVEQVFKDKLHSVFENINDIFSNSIKNVHEKVVERSEVTSSQQDSNFDTFDSKSVNEKASAVKHKVVINDISTSKNSSVVNYEEVKEENIKFSDKVKNIEKEIMKVKKETNSCEAGYVISSNKYSGNCAKVLSPKYNTRWTLRHQIFEPGLEELIPKSGVYIDSIQLAKCKEKSQNCRTLARKLLIEIFSTNALSRCTLDGKDFDGSIDKPRLDDDARAVLLKFVKRYAIKKRWPAFHKRYINRTLRYKLQELRNSFNNYF